MSSSLPCTSPYYSSLGEEEEGGFQYCGMTYILGVATAEDVYERLRAGASVVQLYTALVYQGPGLVRRLLEGLEALLRRDGFARLRDAIGADVKGL